MPSLNQVTLVGHCGKDAEVKTVGSSTLASFSLATRERWKDRNGEPQEHTEWHNVSVWGKTAEAIGKYLIRGKLVLVQGRIESREYEKDGEKRRAYGIKADRVLLLSKDSRPTSGDVQDHGSPFDTDSDYPF